MIPWIQVYSNLSSHRKTGSLTDALGLTNAYVSPNIIAVGILVSLWTWAIQNAPNGDLSTCSARTIAEACRWKKKPETLINALKDTGWIDSDGKLHDWEEYALLLLEKDESRKAKTRERVKRYRERKEKLEAGEGNASSPDCNAPCNVIVRASNASTIPITIPNQDNYSFSLSGACEREEKQEEESGDNGVFTPEFYERQLKTAQKIGWNVQSIVDCARARGYTVDVEKLEVSHGKQA